MSLKHFQWLLNILLHGENTLCFFFFTLYPERHSSHMSSLKWSRNIYYMAFLLEESYSFQLVNTDPIRGIGDTQRHFGCHD